jgi:hypothetical protein
LFSSCHVMGSLALLESMSLFETYALVPNPKKEKRWTLGPQSLLQDWLEAKVQKKKMSFECFLGLQFNWQCSEETGELVNVVWLRSGRVECFCLSNQNSWEVEQDRSQDCPGSSPHTISSWTAIHAPNCQCKI